MSSNYCNFQVRVNLTNSDYTNTIHAVEISQGMKFSEFKRIIETNFSTNKFCLSFCEILIDSDTTDYDDKPIEYFLFKENSLIGIFRKDIEYTLSSNSVELCPTKIIRMIGSHKWIDGHIRAYQINKPVIVQSGMGYIYIIVPNGKKYFGLVDSTLKEYYADGFTDESFATKSEIYSCDNTFDCYYYNF